MKALVLEGIQRLSVQDLPTPSLAALGVLLEIKANGVCRSDWHAWIGDTKRDYPMVLGHEMTGVVVDVAPGVMRFKKGDRVVVPFCGSDGTCEYCQRGWSHLCDNLNVPGRSYSGGYAEYVSVPLADRNLVHLPDEISFTDGAALGCRFMTAFHALVGRAELKAGESVVVYGCGGVGLAAINIAAALGANVIGVDVNPANLALAKAMGAHHTIDTRGCSGPEAVMEITRGGAHVAVDALGIAETCISGLNSLRKGGRHVQVGLTTKKEAGFISLPVDMIVYRELKLLGSLGMPAYGFDAMMPMVARGQLTPGKMVTREIGLADVVDVFEGMSKAASVGAHVVTNFS